MAGKNIGLQPGEIVFQKGDVSDGMYLVRQGQLEVFLEQNGREVTLASVSAGGMIGEMALFDQLPRSASVKAITATEVTLISNEDFQSLMKQIPKWFTALMSTLSGRLRATNERLQKTEAQSTSAMQSMLSAMRIIHVLDLLWHRDGQKEGKRWILEKEPSVTELAFLFSEEKPFIEKILMVLTQAQMISECKNNYNHAAYSLANKSVLRQFSEFFHAYLADATVAAIPDAALDLLTTISTYSEESAYETLTVSLADLEQLARNNNLTSMEHWKKHLPFISRHHNKVIQTVRANGGEVTFKIRKKDIKNVVHYHSLIKTLHIKLLDQAGKRLT